MNFERFIAQRIIGAKTYKNSVSGPIIKIGITKLKHNPIDSVESIEVVAGKGIKGDRKFQDNNAKDQQLTLIESENIDYYNEKYNSNFSYLDFRRNLITKNLSINLN